MTAPRDPDRMIRAFIGEGADRLADPVYDAVRAQIDTKQQRAVIGPWRVPTMNKIVAVAVGAAAVVAVLVVGAQVIRPSEPSGVGGQPAAVATAAPTVTPAATPGAGTPRMPTDGPVPAGTYVVSDSVSSMRITLPDGWTAATGGTDLRKNRDQPGEVGLIIFNPDIGVFADACQTDRQPPATGPSLADLVAALQDQKGIEVSEPEAIAIGGATGVRLTVTLPADFDYGSCTEGIARIWSNHDRNGGNYLAVGPNNGEAHSDTIYIVEGPAGRIVFAPGVWADTSDADRAELAAVIDSIVMEPAP